MPISNKVVLQRIKDLNLEQGPLSYLIAALEKHATAEASYLVSALGVKQPSSQNVQRYVDTLKSMAELKGMLQEHYDARRPTPYPIPTTKKRTARNKG